MPITQVAREAVGVEVECVLSMSDSYIETLSIRKIEAQPSLVELVIRTQLLHARNPDDIRVKSRTCIERAHLAEIRDAIDRYFMRERSSDAPVAAL